MWWPRPRWKNDIVSFSFSRLAAVLLIVANRSGRTMADDEGQRCAGGDMSAAVWTTALCTMLLVLIVVAIYFVYCRRKEHDWSSLWWKNSSDKNLVLQTSAPMKEYPLKNGGTDNPAFLSDTNTDDHRVVVGPAGSTRIVRVPSTAIDSGSLGIELSSKEEGGKTVYLCEHNDGSKGRLSSLRLVFDGERKQQQQHPIALGRALVELCREYGLRVELETEGRAESSSAAAVGPAESVRADEPMTSGSKSKNLLSAVRVRAQNLWDRRPFAFGGGGDETKLGDGRPADADDVENGAAVAAPPSAASGALVTTTTTMVVDETRALASDGRGSVRYRTLEYGASPAEAEQYASAEDDGVQCCSINPPPGPELVAVAMQRSAPPATQSQTPVTQPQTPMTQPQTHMVKPQTQIVQPQTVQPQTQTVQPQTQTVQPQTQTVQPQTQTVQPQTQTVQPQTQAVQPQTQTVQPQMTHGAERPEEERKNAQQASNPRPPPPPRKYSSPSVVPSSVLDPNATRPTAAATDVVPSANASAEVVPSVNAINASAEVVPSVTAAADVVSTVVSADDVVAVSSVAPEVTTPIAVRKRLEVEHSAKNEIRIDDDYYWCTTTAMAPPMSTFGKRRENDEAVETVGIAEKGEKDEAIGIAIDCDRNSVRAGGTTSIEDASLPFFSSDEEVDDEEDSADADLKTNCKSDVDKKTEAPARPVERDVSDSPSATANKTAACNGGATAVTPVATGTEPKSVATRLPTLRLSLSSPPQPTTSCGSSSSSSSPSSSTSSSPTNNGGTGQHAPIVSKIPVRRQSAGSGGGGTPTTAVSSPVTSNGTVKKSIPLPLSRSGSRLAMWSSAN